jgi:ABC-type transport system substrate-binding protein
MKRRQLLGSGAALLGTAPVLTAARPGAAARSGGRARTLRLAMNTAESGFDPPRVGDATSIMVVSHIFEAPLAWDPLARPAKLVPRTAEALPEVHDDYTRWVFTIRRGIHFADDPVFQGQPRELTAADYVYTIKRLYDPAITTEHLYQWENAGLLGMSELRRRALQRREPFNYDEPVPGLRALDRYRFELRLSRPAPRFAALFTSPVIAGAVAREVVEAYAADPMAHPVGTGPFRLAQWRRASRIVLERNPNFREQRFVGHPAEGDADAQAEARRLAGARAPLLDRIEIDIIEEVQPRWLAFLGGEHDFLDLPPVFADLAIPGGQLAPFLQRQGVQQRRSVTAAITHTFFNFDNPVVGGYTAEKVALRRAIALAWDDSEHIRLLTRGQAIVAHSMIPPHCYGYDPALRSEMGAGDLPRAKALLAMHGYLDRDGDGWRELPDGSRLELRLAFPPDQRSRLTSEIWLKRLTALGVRVRFEVAPFAELIKRALAGQLMMWGFIWSAGDPDGDFFLSLAYGPNAEQNNDARFRLPAFDALYERQRSLPDGPERLALMQQANKLMLAYVPYLAHNHPVQTDLTHAHVRMPPRSPFARDWFVWADVSDGGA